MADIALDIETVALPLDKARTEFLTKLSKTDAEREEALKQGALNPFTGRIACIGVRNPETSRGTCMIIEDEAALLKEFWTVIVQYKRIITFNGRGFDIPFLIARSVSHGIIPSRRDLMEYRYKTFPHLDLLDQFTFYGAVRRLPLDAYCRMWGIDSPKEQCDGSHVGALYAAKEFGRIVEYNTDDLRANCDLYNIWRRYYEVRKA